MKSVRRGRLTLEHKGISRGVAVALILDGESITAYQGETVAAVLVAEGGLTTRETVGGAARGIFCGMGVCYDCLVVVDDVPNTRACMTYVADGMRIDRQSGAGLSAHH
jgi:D-hydroxyproline dehydrogenase subunit gamma